MQPAMHHHRFHRSPSPRGIDDLPEAFHCARSPREQGSTALPTPSASTSSASSVHVKADVDRSTHFRAPSVVEYESTAGRKRPRDEVDQLQEDVPMEFEQDYSGKGKGKARLQSFQDMQDDECSGEAVDPFASLPLSFATAKLPVLPYRRPHHPQNEQQAASNQGLLPFSGFGVKGNPGGDCKRICLRHQRMVDGGARLDLQKRLETLSETEQQTANTIWSLFSASSGAARTLTLRGLLSICCPSQLSFLSEQLKAECRMDPFAVLPRELALRCMSFLDAMSLGRAAQVSKSWKQLADDDLLWRTMCEQHIERKCEKCGWGLPLLERKRRQREPAAALSAALAQAQQKYDALQHNHTPLPKTLEEALSPSSASNMDALTAQARKSGLGPSSLSSTSQAQFEALNRNSPTTSSFSNSNAPPSASASVSSQLQVPPAPLQITRPWKSVYCERLAIARNWARGNCKFRVLSGHSDAVTCLQIDESLTNPPYPVLMTGSWDRTVRIWNAETGQCMSVLRGHTRGVRCLQFDSVKLITGGMDANIKLWNWKTGKCLRTLEGHRDSVISLCFDKQVLASGSSDSTIKVWDFNTAECFTLRGHREWVNQVKIWSPESTDCTVTPAESELSRNGASAEAGPSSTSHQQPTVKLLFSSSDDGTVKIWDLLTRTCVRTLEGHVAQVQCLRILSVDEHSAAPFPVKQGDQDSASYINAAETTGTAVNNRSQVTDGNAYEGFFDQPQQTEAGNNAQASFVPASQLSQATPNPLAFLEAASRSAPDPATLPYIDFGNSPAPLLVSGSLDNTIKVWNVEEGSCARTMFGHIEGVWAVDMDKLRIVSASHDRTIKVWDRNSGRCLHTLVGHRGAVTSIGLGDDKIISGSDDCTVRIWSFAQ